MLVAATYRDDELDRTHPLRIALGEIATRPVIERVAVEPLSRAAVAELAASAGVDADELYRKTGGNPFFVTEVLATGDGSIPHTVVDAVLARIARLSPSARAVIDAVAISPPAPSPGCSRRWWATTRAASTSASAPGCSCTPRDGIEFRHELARLAIEDSIEPRRRVALTGARSRPRSPPGGDPTSRDSPTTPRRPATPTPCSSYAPAAGDRASTRRRTPRSGGAVRGGAPPRRCARAGRTRRLAAPLRGGVLPHGPHGRRGRGARGGGRPLSAAGRHPPRGRHLAPAVQHPLVPGPLRRSATQAASRPSAMLEPSPPGPELVRAYANLWFLYGMALRRRVRVEREAVALAERLGRADMLAHALWTTDETERALGARPSGGTPGARRGLAAALCGDRALAALVRHRGPVPRCGHRPLRQPRQRPDPRYFLAEQALAQLDRGLWDAAAESAAQVLRLRAVSTFLLASPRSSCSRSFALAAAIRTSSHSSSRRTGWPSDRGAPAHRARGRGPRRGRLARWGSRIASRR